MKLLLCVAIVTVAGLSRSAEAKSVADFFEERDRILGLEDASYLGSDLILDADEVMANEYLMTHKVNGH
jgi:hypothetical protein